MPARPPEPSVAQLSGAPGGAPGSAPDSAPDDEALALYWRFYWAVAAAQLTRWLPARPARVLDLAGTARSAQQAAAAGHQVIEVLERPVDRPPTDHRPPAPRSGEAPTGPRRLVADSGSLRFLSDACVDAVIAENRVLSRHLVTEAAVAEIARVLRPGGRVLLSVDSLTLGMAVLAEQNCWAHLSDVPRAEVLLVPWPDGTITRCFWTDQLRELLAGAGLEVEWIRPRTVLSPSTVEHVLARSPRALPRLVRTELAAPDHRDDDSLGVHLLASARRPHE